MQDKVMRSLVIVVLVPGAAVLALLLGWLTMVGMMAGGMMSGGMPQATAMPMDGRGIGVSLVGILVLVAIVVALVWALRTPAHHNG